MGKTWIKFVFRLVMSGLFVGYLAYKLDWGYLWQIFLKVDIGLYCLALICELIPSFLLAIKHHLLIRKTALNLSVFSLFKINMITRFYSLFIPTALGAETVRWYGVTKNKKGRAVFFSTIMFERITLLASLILLGLLPLFLNRDYPGVIQLRRQLSYILMAAMGASVLLMIYFLSPFVQEVLTKLLGKLPGLRILKDLSEKIRLPDLSLRVLFNLLLLQVVFVAVFQLRTYLLFESLGLHIRFLDAAWMGVLVLLLQILPVTIAGIGLREGAYAYLFTLFLLPPDKGVVVGVLIFTQIVIWAFAGWVLDWFGQRRPEKHPADPDSTGVGSIP